MHHGLACEPTLEGLRMRTNGATLLEHVAMHETEDKPVDPYA